MDPPEVRGLLCQGTSHLPGFRDNSRKCFLSLLTLISPFLLIDLLSLIVLAFVILPRFRNLHCTRNRQMNQHCPVSQGREDLIFLNCVDRIISLPSE